MDNPNTASVTEAINLQQFNVTPELSKKLKMFVESIVRNKSIYFSSQSSEGSEDSESSEGSENSESSEESEGSESEIFQSILAIDPNPNEWGQILAFSNAVATLINKAR